MSPRPRPPRDAIDLGAREHYADAALYDHEYKRRRADVLFYRDLARRVVGDSGGPILELGCGTGRVTVPLARDGHRVVALDQSEAMLAGLEARRARLPAVARERITVVRGDLRDFALGRRFPLIIAAFNVLEHLYTRVELDACLRAVRRHLAPDGCFAFDVQLPDLGWLLRDPSRRWARTRFTHPTTGKRVWYATNHDYDPISQIALIRIYYTPEDGTPEHVVLLSQRKYFPAELEALVAHAGLRVVERTDFQGAPLGPHSESQVLLCAKSSTRKSRSSTGAARTFR
ncbi:MAG TPA: methyltransferase domain-containing protein [Vicinamibacterales bacterium]|nr:methyltransferase domain-containing protein [Vicinamibacterales bacterium]